MQKLTPREAPSFAELAPAALWIAGNLDGVQPIRLGENRGAWPVAIGVTHVWANFNSPKLRAYDPYHQRAVLARHWCQTRNDADRLWCGSLRINGIRKSLG